MFQGTLTAVAEEFDLSEKSPTLHVEECEGYKEEEIKEDLGMYADVLSASPGQTDVMQMEVKVVEGTPVISQMQYPLPDRLKEPVKQELDDLLQAGIIAFSGSHWASTLAPVPKPPGTVQ